MCLYCVEFIFVLIKIKDLLSIFIVLDCKVMFKLFKRKNCVRIFFRFFRKIIRLVINLFYFFIKVSD